MYLLNDFGIKTGSTAFVNVLLEIPDQPIPANPVALAPTKLTSNSFNSFNDVI